MAKLIRRRQRALPLMFTELMMASWETIARRSLMMAQGRCSHSEYRRITIERAVATQESALAMTKSTASIPPTRTSFMPGIPSLRENFRLADPSFLTSVEEFGEEELG
jgi:hypothetical protein